ncbi:ComE operon protein 3 [subsurface metagenome]
MPLIYLSCAWVAGILLGSICNLPLALIFSGLIPLPLLFFLRKYKKSIILTSLCITALFGGAFCFQSSQPPNDESSLQFYNNQTVAVKGMVSTDPEIGGKTIRLRLSSSEIERGGEWQKVSGTVLVFVPRYSTYRYGDVLLVNGKLEKPPWFDDYDDEKSPAHQEIYSTMLYPRVEIMDRGRGLKPLEWVYSLRNHLSQSLGRVLPEPQASLAQGIVLGIRGNIPPPLKEAFVATGTAHLLAVSGLHLGIIAVILLSLGAWLLGRRHHTYIWLALSTIWFYALITGLHPPVTRAAIMASLFLAAGMLGRQRSGMTALTLTAAIMAGITPQILWTASFQLSFLAMAGIFMLFPHFQDIGRKVVTATIGEDGKAAATASFTADSFSVTMAAVIAVWPVVAYHFGIISLVAPLVNILTLPALPGIIIFGLLTGVMGIIFLPLAQIVAWLAWLFLSYMILVVNGFAAIPLSSIEVGDDSFGSSFANSGKSLK